MRNYQTLDACKSAMELVKNVYLLTKTYHPKKELYALSSQTKGALASIPSNITEGMERQYKKRHNTVSSSVIYICHLFFNEQ
jgi:four helix bundle protein